MLRMIKVDRDMIGQATHFRWGPIIGGTLLTFGFSVFFLLIGNAIGLNAYNIVDPAVHGGLRVWSWMYMAVVMVLSYGIGSSLSYRSQDSIDGLSFVHGLMTWALVTSVGGLILAFTSPIARAVFGGVGPNSANWLALTIVLFGLVASVSNGLMGMRGARPIPEGERPIVDRRQTGVA